MSDLLTMMRKTQEAYCVRNGLQVERQFTDAELEYSNATLDEIEAELYPGMSREEALGRLSPEENAMLARLNAQTLIPFRVTVTTADSTEQINILATDACMANVRAAEIMFSGFDCEKPMAFKIKVEPIQTNELRRAA